MINRGFTGTQNPPGGSRNVVRLHLMTLDPSKDQLIIGVCIGIDQIVGEEGHKLGFQVHAVVPSNRSKIDHLFPNYCTSIEFMPDSTDYMDRNQRIVDLSFDLTAFPLRGIEELRSGTWSTVRRARWKKIPVVIIPLLKETVGYRMGS